MANNYLDTTGVLVLEKVTSVITALFGDFNLDESYPGNGRAYIAITSEKAAPTWYDILEGLQKLTADLGLSIPGVAENSPEEHLYVLASHFGADQDYELANLIDSIDYGDDPAPSIAFDLAIKFNDGHGLTSMELEGSWSCSKPRLFEFGGYGEFHGRHIFVHGSSTSTLQYGKAMNSALEEGNLDKATAHVVRQIGYLLSGISNSEILNSLRATVGNILTAKSNGQHSESLMKWFAVTGRIPGDDEDSCLVFQDVSRGGAIESFEQAMFEGKPSEARDNVFNEHGASVFINSVVVSNTPIEQI